VLLSIVGFSPKTQAAAGIYKTVNFQGKVVNTNGTNVADASYTFRFRIYTSTAPTDATNACSANSCLWEESKSITTVNGIFQTNLGDTTTLPGSVDFNSDTLQLAVKFNGDTEMSPRVRLTAVPYAFNSDMLDGLDSSALVQLTPASQQSGSINVSGGITSGGTVSANTVDAYSSGALTLGSTNATGLTLAKSATMAGGLTLSLQGNNSLNLGSTSAAGGIVFKDGTVNNRAVTISTVALTASYSLNLPATSPSAGFQCLQTASGSTTDLTFASCGTGLTYVTLQAGTPGTPDTGNINISGVGIAASFKAAAFDTATGVLMSIGTGTATSITIGQASVTTSVAGPLSTQDITLAANKSITFTAGTGTFDQSGSTGTFKSGQGANTLSGNTTVAAGKSLSLASGVGTFSQVYTGTSTDANTITANSLTTASAFKVTSANNSAANTAWSGVSLNVTNAQATTAVSTGTIAGLDLQFTQNPTVAGNTETVANLAIKQIDTSVTDNTVGTILNLANNDTATGNQITATDGLKITGTNVTNGINLSGTFGTNLITSSNFSVSQAGAITGVGVNSGAGLIQGTNGLTITGTAALNTTGTATTSIGNGTGTLALASNTFNLSTLGAITGATGYAQASGNFLQSGVGTFGTGTGAVSLNGTTTIAANKNLIYTAGTGTFDQSASSGAFATGTGAVSLNGDTTVASGKTLTVNGITTIKATSATALTIQNAAGSATLFTFDSSSGNFSLGSGAGRTIAIAAPAAGAGNDLTVKGSAAGTGNVNGGNLVLSGGAGTGTGVQGLVNLATSAFSSSSVQTNTIAAGIVDQFSSIPVTANTTGLTVTVPSPISAVTGRILYVAAAGGSNDFTLFLSGTSISIAMKQNSTATLIWNGTGWTAAGASSSTDLQSAYNNTLTSAGGAEIVLNGTGGNADGFTIRNNATSPIAGGLLEVQASIGTNLLSVNYSGTELAANGGAETSGTFATDWTAVGAPTITRHTTLSNVATGQASAQVSTTVATNTGVRNNLAANPTVSSTYMVSFTGKLNSGSFSTLDVQYSRDGGTDLNACSSYSTQTLVTTGWSKVTCTFSTDVTAATNPDLIIRQTDATSRIFWIDNLSVTILTATSTPPNVQIGGGLYGGPTTVLTLDRASSAPVATGNTALLGSMYYDTTSGRIQCYEADGWGACGSSPDNYVNLVPEYPGAVLGGPGNGGTAGIGTLTADFCATQVAVLIYNTALCSTGQALNFYKWTSPQATQQIYTVYVTYQLPAAFKQFQTDTTVQLTARTDNTTNGIVTYEMFRSEGGTLSACGTETTVTSSINTWQTVGINGNELTGCGFSSASANNFAIFKINVKANSNANVYVGTLSFTTTGQ
jgi:hypothetical protein